MIPIEILRSIGADSTNDELRDLAKSHDLDLSDLWAVRRKKKNYFERGVDITRRSHRRG